MKLGFKSPVSVAIAISFGMVVLLGYFFGVDASGEVTMLGILRDYFLRGAVVISAIALVVGIVNLVTVHVNKIKEGNDAGFSFLVVISLVLTLIIGIYDMGRMNIDTKPNFQLVQWIFDNIQLPIETSLMAVLCISMTYAAARLIGKRMTIFSVIFVGTLLLLFLGAIPQISTIAPLFGEIRAWIIQVPAVGGARGILLGVALGTIATGIRILMGIDRPYKG